ncbi:putative MFS transporter [Truncatella angustata]|uniref:MFS transporter n=1 Tax=Truncatella angustata TaxID=152316 RepID=A0A9P8RN21_9PEZI|nr:putative MFS transporter [Truncatella angustata]KAH6646240.1 putative MFS transporter [Truncatella angustata]
MAPEPTIPSSYQNSSQETAILEKRQRIVGKEQNSQQGPADIEYPTGFRFYMILIGLVLSFFLSALDMSIIGTAAPSITTEFHSTPDVGWYGSSFLLTLAAFQSHWGKAYLYFPLKWSFLCSVAVFEIGSLVCGVAPSSIALIVGRAVQGAGAAGITGGCYTIASFITPPSKVPALIGMLGSVFTIASVAGPLLGGAFTSTMSWRWCFYINLPIGGLAFACLLFFFHTPPHSRGMIGKLPWGQIALQFDPVGTVLLIASLVCFILAMQYGGISKAWNSSDVIGLLVGWCIMSIAFAINEWYQGDKALVVYRILRNRSIAACCGFIFFMMCGNLSLYYSLPIYFQAIAGDTPMASGLKFIPTILCTSITTFLTTVFVGKTGMFQPFIMAGAILQTLGVGLYYTFGLDTGLGPIIGYQIIYGIGCGLGIQTAIVVGQTLSPVEDMSMTLATIIFFQFVSGAYGVSSTNSVLDNILIKKVVEYAPDISPVAVLEMGATGIREAYHNETFASIRQAFLEGVRASLILSCAFLGVSILWTLAPKWPGRLSRPSQISDDTDTTPSNKAAEAVLLGEGVTSYKAKL